MNTVSANTESHRITFTILENSFDMKKLLRINKIERKTNENLTILTNLKNEKNKYAKYVEKRTFAGVVDIPYKLSFLAFSKYWRSASAGL